MVRPLCWGAALRCLGPRAPFLLPGFPLVIDTAARNHIALLAFTVVAWQHLEWRKLVMMVSTVPPFCNDAWGLMHHAEVTVLAPYS